MLAIALAFTAIELTHKNSELWAARHPTYHRHADVRTFMIRAALNDAKSPIVIAGDSITEMARFPETACGHSIINAGIGGASTTDFLTLAPLIFDAEDRPAMIVVALGANDGADGLSASLSELLRQLKALTPNVVMVTDTANNAIRNEQRSAAASAHVPFVAPNVSGLMLDKIHFTSAGYSQWLPPIMDAIMSACSEPPK